MVSPLYGQRVYADTSALIYAFEALHQYPRMQTNFLDLVARGDLMLVKSWITFAEVLVKHQQTGNAIAEAGYRAFFQPSSHFEILVVDQTISEQAAALRVLHGFRLPDAIHIATGMTAGCTRYLTGDAKWTQTGLHVINAANL